MDLDAYRRLQATARRCARRADEAEDLLQDALLAGLEQGRDDPAWLAGTVRNLALMQARGAARRRRREAAVALCEHPVALPSDDAPDHAAHGLSAPLRTSPARTALLAALPPSARRVAVLALHGLNAEEIRCVLGIADTAFRQRLSTIRRALGTLAPALRAEALALAYVRDPARSVDLQFGLVRRALKAALAARQGHDTPASVAPGLGTHDVDGHLLVLRPARSGALAAGRRPAGQGDGPSDGAGDDRHDDRAAHGSRAGGNS